MSKVGLAAIGTALLGIACSLWIVTRLSGVSAALRDLDKRLAEVEASAKSSGPGPTVVAGKDEMARLTGELKRLRELLDKVQVGSGDGTAGTISMADLYRAIEEVLAAQARENRQKEVDKLVPRVAGHNEKLQSRWAKELTLTEAQVLTLAEIMKKDGEATLAAMRENEKGEQRQAQIDAAHAAAEQQIEAMLTPEQKQKWKVGKREWFAGRAGPMVGPR